MPDSRSTGIMRSPLGVGRARLWLRFVSRFGVFRELGPLGLLVEPDCVILCWRRVTRFGWRFRPRLGERLFIAAAKIATTGKAANDV